MEWHYIRHARLAIETESGLQFRVGKKGVVGEELNPAELEFEALEREGQQRLKKNGETIRRKVVEAIYEARRRDEMRELIKECCQNSCGSAAVVIEKGSERRLSSRTVQSWLLDASKPSSRSCPEWAIKVMREFKNARSHEQRHDHYTAPPRPWDVETIDNRTVEIATVRLQLHQKREARWIDAPLSEYPRMLAAQEKRNRELLDRHDNLLSTFRICLKNSSSFEEFKKMCKSELDARDAVDFEVGQTERDIEEAFGEFANSDGTLDEERLEPSY